MTNILTLDVESTIYKYPGDRRSSDRRGSVYSQHNGLVSVCYKLLNEDVVHSMYMDEINNTKIIVGLLDTDERIELAKDLSQAVTDILKGL